MNRAVFSALVLILLAGCTRHSDVGDETPRLSELTIIPDAQTVGIISKVDVSRQISYNQFGDSDYPFDFTIQYCILKGDYISQGGTLEKEDELALCGNGKSQQSKIDPAVIVTGDTTHTFSDIGRANYSKGFSLPISVKFSDAGNYTIVVFNMMKSTLAGKPTFNYEDSKERLITVK